MSITSTIGGATFTAPYAPSTAKPVTAVNTKNVTSGTGNLVKTTSGVVAAASPKVAAPAPPQAGGGGAANTYVDPYAGTVFGSSAGHAQAVSDYNSLKGTTLDSINQGIGDAGTKYNSSILDYLDSRKAAQNTINGNAVQNELARQNGSQGVLDMVGNGIKSGGVIIGNAGGGTSSAGEALARAYGTLGRQQQSSVNNQAAQGSAQIQVSQDNLLAGDATQLRHTQEDKATTINSIVNDATSKLASLNAAAATASLPDRIQIDKQIATIKQQALDSLSRYDQTLSQGIASNGPQSSDATEAEANRLRTAGVAPATQFDYTTAVPSQFQGTGDFASSLPIFTAPKKQVTA